MCLHRNSHVLCGFLPTVDFFDWSIKAIGQWLGRRTEERLLGLEGWSCSSGNQKREIEKIALLCELHLDRVDGVHMKNEDVMSASNSYAFCIV